MKEVETKPEATRPEPKEDKPYVNRGVTNYVKGYVHKDNAHYRNDGHKHLKSFGSLT